MDADRILGGYTHRIMHEQQLLWESHVQAKIRPRPRWVPNRLWHWLLSKMLVIEVRHGR